jgi:hypothetical protein
MVQAVVVDNKVGSFLRSRHFARSIGVLLAICFFLLMANATLNMKALSLNPDEGPNLMKASLLNDGYRLYRDIWSDQPPIFTWLLAGKAKLFGPSVDGCRFLVILLSCMTLLAIYQTAYRLDGFVAAIAAMVFVSASDHFILLSSSIMIGLPAIALGILAVWMLVEWRSTSRSTGIAWFVGSAVTLAVSAQTKFFTLTMIPSFLVLILIPGSIAHPALGSDFEGQGSKPGTRRMKLAMAWIGCFAISLAFIAWIAGEDWHQLILPHLRARENVYFSAVSIQFGDLCSEVFLAAPYALLLSVAGLMINLYRRRWDAIAPVLWLLTAGASLLNHRPIWYDHAPLLAIPLAWAAAQGVEGIQWLGAIVYNKTDANDRGSSKRAVLSLLLFFIVSAAIMPVGWVLISQIDDGFSKVTAANPKEAGAHEIIETLLLYKNKTHWVFTDLPIYPYVTGLVTPPELAVITVKRIGSGFLPDDYLIAMLEKYKPEQVLIGRFNYSAAVMDYLHKNYVQVPNNHGKGSRSFEQYVAIRIQPPHS